MLAPAAFVVAFRGLWSASPPAKSRTPDLVAVLGKIDG